MAIRIVGVDLPQNKRGEIALTYIYGIGRSASKSILEKAGVDRDLCCDCFFCHINSYYLVAFFLFATVFFLPLRVRALFFVLWPLKGKPIR